MKEKIKSFPIIYEIKMFCYSRISLIILEKDKERSGKNEDYGNKYSSCLEVFLLHARNLIEFFFRPKSGRHKDDVRINDCLMEEDKAKLDINFRGYFEKEKEYGGLNLYDSISKRLTHVTNIRPVGDDKKWKTEEIFNKLIGSIESALRFLPENKKDIEKLINRYKKEISAIDPNREFGARGATGASGSLIDKTEEIINY